MYASYVNKLSGGKNALSLSDVFCVEAHRDSFLDLIKENIDYVFSNEDELKALKKELKNKNFDEKVSFYSLPEDRADILEYAIAIFIEIMEFFPNSYLFDSSWNIVDGVMEKELQESKNIQAA